MPFVHDTVTAKLQTFDGSAVSDEIQTLYEQDEITLGWSVRFFSHTGRKLRVVFSDMPSTPMDFAGPFPTRNDAVAFAQRVRTNGSANVHILVNHIRIADL